MNLMPASSQARAKAAFSERKAVAGWMASTPRFFGEGDYLVDGEVGAQGAEVFADEVGLVGLGAEEFIISSLE